MPEHNPEIRTRPELPLFEQAHARNSDPATSHKAAASVTNLGPTKDLILAILREFGPMHDEAIIGAFRANRKYAPNASDSGIRTRRSWLVDHGFIEDSGQRAKTASGRESIVWRIA